MSSEQPDIVMLSETHVTENIEGFELNLDGYNIFNCESNSKHTGGVLICVRNELQYEIKCKLKVDMQFWLLSVNVWLGGEKWLVTTIYRSPSSSVGEFKVFFTQWCNEYLNENEGRILLTGDFNVDLLKTDGASRMMMKFISDQGLKQIVDKPTRITENSKTLIDYVILDLDNMDVSVNLDPVKKVSDHETICIKIQVRETPKAIKKSIKLLKYNRSVFNELLQSVNFEDMFANSDINSVSLEFKEKLIKCVDSLTYCKVINSNNGINGSNRWFDSTLARMKLERDISYRRASFYGDNCHWLEYKMKRNTYKNALVKSKDTYIKQQIESKSGDQKGMWKVIKDLLLARDNSNSFTKLNINNEMITNSEEIAERLNRYFVQSIEEINASIPQIPFIISSGCAPNIFSFRYCNENSLLNTIQKLNKKKDCDGINTEMIHQSLEIIGPILMHIINLSLTTGIFPCHWKESIIIPIEKVKMTIKCEEIRPINMLPVYEKVLEKFVADQLQSYVESNKILMEEQSGFRQGHSCETALNGILYEWKKEIDSGNSIIAVFLDFKRAFETLDISILLEKLQIYGIEGKENSWFRAYLTGRTQRTRVNGILSTPQLVRFGVPQGSILGVLLFLLYINDMGKHIKYCKITLFADDTLIYICGSNITEMTSKLNYDLENMSIWLKMNKLKLNLSKTKCMVFNTRMSIPVIIDGAQIEMVSNIKYLGVIIDSKLKFEEHADYICRKVAMKIGFLRRIRKKLSLKNAIMIYNTLILPHFNYCSSILLSTTSEVMDRLQILQNKAMRIILRCSIYTPLSYMLETLQWMNIKKKITFNALIFVFKVKHNMFPEYLRNAVPTVNQVQPYQLRHGSNFRLDKYRKAHTQNSIMYKGLKLFNSLPNELKQESRLNIFKIKLKEYCSNFE